MTRIAVLTSATGGGGGIAAVRVYNSIVGAKGNNDTVDLLSSKDFGGPVPSDVAFHSGGSNKIFSDTHYTVEFPGYVRSEVVEQLLIYDAINIHWCSYLITLSEIKEILKAGKKVVFTCHDFYYFLGGCHYPHTCTSWQTSCITCPQLDTIRFPDYSPRDNLEFKKQIFAYPNAQLTAPSNYLTRMAAAILPDAANQPLTIRNPLDSSIFFKSDQHAQSFDDNQIKILMVADSTCERRKAFPLGIKAVVHAATKLAIEGIGVELTLVGGSADYLENEVTAMPTPVKILGKLKPIELAAVYRSVDIVFTPSLEDNWPNILVEAYACGAQFVVGPGHGCEEFVKLYDCGEVSESYDPADFAQLLITLGKTRYAKGKSSNADQYAKFQAEHSPDSVGKVYLGLLSPDRQKV